MLEKPLTGGTLKQIMVTAGKWKIVNIPEQKQENAWKSIKKILVAGFPFG